MKNRNILKWSLGVCLTVLPFAGGCLRAGPETVTNAGAAELSPGQVTNSTTASNADEAALAAATTNAPAVDISQAEVKPIAEEKPLPTNVRTTGPTGELLKLASSGVDEKVILPYITNSASVFSLSADEIIYLKDLGMSSDVIAATLHRDEVLKAAGAPVPVQAEAVAPAVNSGATSNWIGAATQPDASQVAPQATAPPPEGPPASAEPVPAPAPQPEVTYSTFYSSLSPYGTWLEVEGYGRVWQPTVVVVNSGWSPYFDGGRWLYTDRGWYWASDYSWGWAPFHYGRWFRHHRIGWCWTPDLVWGPSWVTWRYNDAYCGWAPLPPAAYYRPGFGFSYYGASVGFGFGFGLGWDCYSFVGWNHFHNHHRNHLYAVSRDRAHSVYNNTKVVTKIVGNNNTVINEGISAQRVAAATRTPVRQVAIREAGTTVPSTRIGRAERLDPAKRTLTVYKPTASSGENAGGIPMERVRTGFTRSTAAPEITRGSAESTVGSRPSVSRPGRETTRSLSTTSSATTPTTTQPTETVTRSRSVTGSDVSRRSVRTAPTKQGTPLAPSTPAASSPQPDNNTATTVSRPLRTATPTARADQPSQVRQPSPLASPRTAETPSRIGRPAAAPSAAPAQTPSARQPSPLASPRTAETPSRLERPSTAPSPARSAAPQAREPSVWASPRASQAPARIDRSPAPSAPRPGASAAPSSSSSSFGQYTAPTAQRQYSAPTIQRPYTAPTGERSYSAPTGQRSYSAPTAQNPYNAPTAQRSYTAPTAQRQYSAPTAQRQYTAPSASYSAPTRSYSPAPSPRSSDGGSSLFAGPRSSGSSPSFSAPQRSSAPSPSVGRPGGGGGGGGSRGRGDR